MMLALLLAAATPMDAFPGAEGAGRHALGGRVSTGADIQNMSVLIDYLTAGR